jgi:DNA-3-methyladenine glycosylase II
MQLRPAGASAISATMWKLAVEHLSHDPAMQALIGRIGNPRLGVNRAESPYESLMRAIAHQQLHGNAARAILGRFVALYPDTPFPTPEQVLGTPEPALRACGFSAAKLATLREICVRTLDGTVPARRACHRLSDEALIERLISIRGVGRWTVEMLLIFTLGRPDVLPVDDFGVRDGYRVLHGLAEQPKPRELARLGEDWAPFRSFAAWYLWRASEAAKLSKRAAREG